MQLCVLSLQKLRLEVERVELTLQAEVPEREVLESAVRNLKVSQPAIVEAQITVEASERRVAFNLTVNEGRVLTVRHSE